MRKKLSKANYNLLFTELSEQRDRGIITQDQLDDMMTFYEKESGLNFIRILVTLGSILIGLGILSLVASNWVYIGKTVKVMIIIAALGSSIFASYKLEKSYPKTSKSLLYLSSLIYGAGIFLIGQIFNFGGDFTTAFLLWAIGVLSIGLILKEKLLYIFAHILLLVYINGSFGENIIVYPLIFIAIFFIGNKYFKFSKLITFFNNIVVLNYILYFLNYIDLDLIFIVGTFFIIGLGMYYIKHDLNIDVFKLQGIIVLGISGFLLTFDYFWENLSFISEGNSFAIGSGIIIFLYLLSLVRKGLLTPLLFIFIFILRYYFDTLYDFMPKSLFFIIGGLILLGFGFYFERIRRKSGGALDEENI